MKLQLPAPGVIAAVTVVVLMGALAFTVWWPYHREQAVIEYLEASGTVDVEYDYRGPSALESNSDSEWLNWFRRIRRIRIDQSGTAVADVPSLSPLLHCDTVALSGCSIERETMQRVAECPRLWSVELENCVVEAGALQGLEGHQQLRDIEMVRSQAEGDVLELPDAPKLMSFRGNFNWSLRALDVSAVRRLRQVEVKNCAFDDEGVTALLEAPRLRVLRMPNTRITDAAFDDILQLESLQFLDLRHEGQLSRGQIERLAELPKLRTVAVWYAIPAEDIDGLRDVLPQATLDPRP